MVSVACLSAVTGGCADDDTASKVNSGSTSTEVTAESSTTTSAKDPGPSTSNASPVATKDQVWSVPGEVSPLDLGAGEPEPEYPAGRDGRVGSLVDGSVDVLVRQVDQPSDQVLVDAVVLIVGAKARPAAIADDRLASDEELVGNYYVRNGNPKLRGATLSRDVVLRAESEAQSFSPVSGVGDVELALIERLGTAPAVPYRARVTDGVITELEIPDVVDPTLSPNAG